MKCPKCNSKDTKKVYVSDPEWHVGHQRCQSALCKYQGDWLEFCEPPIIIGDNPYKIIIPGIDDTGENND
jgi:hypothetical protein